MQLLQRSLFLLWLEIGVTIIATAGEPRERTLFNHGWRFMKGDNATVGDSLNYDRVREWILPTGDHLLNYLPARPVTPTGTPGAIRSELSTTVSYARVDFDDSGWRTLDLPHDWGIEGPFQQELPGTTGKLPWSGVAWYRKRFPLPATDAGRQIYLELDGAMSFAMVWCNDRFVGGWPYGYTSWRVDLTPFIRPGADNLIAIRLDNPRESSRWYPGGGIYRNIWLTKTSPVALTQWGAFVTTPIVRAESALVDVGLTLDNASASTAEVYTNVRLFAADGEGRPIGEPVSIGMRQSVHLTPGRQSHISHTLTVNAPRRWTLQDPQRYVAETIITQGEQVIDRELTPFGIRTIAHTPDGFLLNGERVSIKGVCNHHDLGALGAAVNFRALERQLEILRAMGCNAIRTSHNPPTPELLELCDRMGLMVQVEAFDCWRIGKKRDDYSRIFDDWHEKDLRAMVRRDRNHPSVIEWSIGNEVPEQTEPDGWKLAAHLAAIVREEDRTRAVVSGLNYVESGYNGFQMVLDAVAYNYKPDEYAKLHQRHPHVAVMGGETASTVSSRGEYFFPVSQDKAKGRADFQVSSYDLYAPPWAYPPDVEFKAQATAPFTLGEWVWTGFDYLGEPTPYSADDPAPLNFTDPVEQARRADELKRNGEIAVPSRSSYFGIVDLAGFPKDRYYLYQAHWRPDLPMAHILPHWNWPERVGKVTPVHVYTSGDEAELFLNGQSLGRKRRGAMEYRFCWDEVIYQPGELRVVVYKAGKHWAEEVMKTAGAPAKLTLAADRASLHADGQDLAFVTVTVADQNGLLVPRSKNCVSLEISGPGEIVAMDNGDATSLEPFQSKEHHAYNGLALVVVRTKFGEVGAITLRAKSDGLAAAEANLTSQ